MNACLETWNAECTALAVEALERSGVLRLRLRGESMLPTLWPGDEVEIVSCSPADIRRGDVVLGTCDGRFVLHRLWSFSGNGDVITRGDAMPRPDAALAAGAIVGKVAQVTRDGRTVSVSRRCTSFRRALGILFCYFGSARRIALRIHGGRIAPAGKRGIEFARAFSSFHSHKPLQIQETQPAASLPSRLESTR
jgi:hypothetical protein